MTEIRSSLSTSGYLSQATDAAAVIENFGSALKDDGVDIQSFKCLSLPCTECMLPVPRDADLACTESGYCCIARSTFDISGLATHCHQQFFSLTLFNELKNE